jgi:hypothetical protein
MFAAVLSNSTLCLQDSGQLIQWKYLHLEPPKSGDYLRECRYLCIENMLYDAVADEELVEQECIKQMRILVGALLLH